ncbi:putative transcriptional regulator, PucR family [Segniliparus rotundus DSM 44985]|uniref:Putative transcriptional regulator, PucR family n=1 Tax=Segniliparus rotundus (strain ATCC BAA-972 / CDC 1076 / CIP 108378 / DSM 44985 / JCM 13578) TaxID=640132 RepID=D6ZDJ5_SEGRD|nr:helix-turn-helix domain-containing protein [Segniliparus rotundus]ADG97259.1 putative transcriptional regulator, PucR family [Segniliparus rotundus DSM 44985]
MDTSWPVPSERIQELMRRGATIALTPQAHWIEELHTATLGGQRMRAVADDPVLAEAVRRTNLANWLHWASSNAARPGERVPPNLSPVVLETSRDMVRRGLDQTALDTYRTGQSVAWRRWMDICFGLTSDPRELHELLDLSERSIRTFLDDTIDATSARIAEERDQLVRGSHADRLAAVSLILEGAPIPRARAEEQLGYQLTGPHVAAVVWGSASTPASRLETVAEAFTRDSGAARRLTVLASSATLWLWLPVAAAPACAHVQAHIADVPDVWLGIGRPGRDIDGFRRSHLDAIATQRMLTRLTSPHQVAHYDDIALVALLSSDPARADEFVRDALGGLLAAEPDIRDTVLTYIREQCNTSRAAERLYTHRNTVIRRLARADELLPHPLPRNIVAVAAALEIVRWRGQSTA